MSCPVAYPVALSVRSRTCLHIRWKLARSWRRLTRAHGGLHESSQPRRASRASAHCSALHLASESWQSWPDVERFRYLTLEADRGAALRRPRERR